MEGKGAPRAAEAAHRKQQRQEVRRLRELERSAKEQAKLSTLEQARLEVERFETQVELLLSVHREEVKPSNWPELAAALDPRSPSPWVDRELQARLMACAESRTVELKALDDSRLEDRQAYEELQGNFHTHQQAHQRCRSIAARVLRGDLQARHQAVELLRPFEELEELGVTVKSDFQSRSTVNCSIVVRGQDIIPQDSKTLTSTGKLSIKAMAKSRFHEIFQDYVCGCALRTASEMFGFLPVQLVLVTASVGYIDPSTGRFGIRPVLSVLFPRPEFSNLDLGNVDPSDAIERFTHCGDAKASRKTGVFSEIDPIRIEDVVGTDSRPARFDITLQALLNEREAIRRESARVTARLRTPHAPSTVESHNE